MYEKIAVACYKFYLYSRVVSRQVEVVEHLFLSLHLEFQLHNFTIKAPMGLLVLVVKSGEVGVHVPRRQRLKGD